MQESTKAAMSYVRSRAKRLGLDKDLSKNRYSCSCSRRSQPKDGPSAGIAISTAIISALVQRSKKRCCNDW